MKLLIKIGSALISRGNRIARDWLNTKVDEISMLFREGHQICLVSSGAVAAGMEIQGLRTRPQTTLDLQLLSGQGQVRLYRYYGDFFKERYIFSAQVLLTHHNFDNPQEVETLVQILNEYMRRGVIPIINENDLINKEELEDRAVFSDNDILAALVARAVKADLALILTNVDGLYPQDPQNTRNTAQADSIISEVHEITPEIKTMASQGKSALGLGGMLSKVQAAEMITAAGLPLIIANGNYSLQDIIENKVPRTYFYPKK
jgi:glutamate 5-kinase